ncbi:MAG: DNA polymerase III subunit alpha [Methylococcales bacterium]|jgi:DNA polymerase III subunit alpha|nr:DNA polymerase III subunit alpha [Methylococcales bacterium]
MTAPFVHLHIHSEYSLVDGVVRIKPLIKMAAGMNIPALAVTDQSNMFALIKFYRAAQGSGIKPIAGSDVYIENIDDDQKPYRVILLAQNLAGYRSLTRLVSKGYTDGQHLGKPIIKMDWLSGENDNIIAIAGMHSDVGHAIAAEKLDVAAERFQFWSELFPNRYYIELCRTNRPGENEFIRDAVTFAAEHELPVVATNDVRFLNKEDFYAHEARVCIHDGQVLHDNKRPKKYSEEQYFKSPEDMATLFSDIPSALENTLEIAKRCSLEIELGINYLPNFPVPEGMTMDEFFSEESKKGLELRLDFLFDVNADDFAEKRKPYDDRLQIELDVINQMGFPGYFLIVADFIQWAKDNDIPVGPGRGSGAGSIVAYALKITDLDPLEFDLLFERFLNPERVSMPDFDIDFCMDGRDRVIDYVAKKYGRESVSQIITYGSMAAKAVIRDVGRAMAHPYGFVDRIAKLIPFEIGMTLTKALEESTELKELYDTDDEVKDLIDLALSLEGVSRNAGKHAGGVVISPSALTDFAPLYCEEDRSNMVTQFDKDDVEAVGLVKFDFLGLRTLTIIDWALQNVQKLDGGEKMDILALPFDDKKSFDLLKACETTAVFQLESRGMKDLIGRLQPDVFEDVVALVALFRPGPLQSGMVDDFINRKHGRQAVEYPHPDLEPILEPTYGVILYQEQVMQIAQVLANYSLGGADMLRRAMGKKKPEVMAEQRVIFTKGAVARDVEESTATYIFDLMEKFAGYGFNKSHSAAYALLAYQTAWLKAHHPAEFMAAVMSADMDNTEKVVILVEECRAMKLITTEPNVNRSFYQFTVSDKKTVVYGLGAIKGVGEGAIENIIEEREANGTYKDLFDFCRRVDLRKCNKRVLEGLIRSGALDACGENRATMWSHLPAALKAADQHKQLNAVGQEDMFGFESSDHSAADDLDLPLLPEWNDDIRLNGEKETLGLYLTGHPIDQYEQELRQFVPVKIVNLQVPNSMAPAADDGGKRRWQRGVPCIAAGMIVAYRTMKTSRGGFIAFLTLDDRSARVEVSVFSEPLEMYRDLLVKDNIVVIEGSLSMDDYSGGLKISAEKVYDIDGARSQFAKRILIGMDGEKVAPASVKQLAGILQEYRDGKCPVWVDYKGANANARLRLDRSWTIRPSKDMVARVCALEGYQSVRIIY